MHLREWSRTMNAGQFRQIALSMPDAFESVHMGHPDFRVGGKIFATLGSPDERLGVVMLAPEEQQSLLRDYPDVFTPAKGAWGERGSTNVRLEIVSAPVLREVMWSAWRKRAPKRVIAQHEADAR